MEIPNQLKKSDFRFVLLKPKEKVPFERDWQNTANYLFNDEKLLNHPGNYGVIGGYGNLIIVDFDSKECEKKYVPLLPKTFSVQTGSGGLHLYYLTGDTKSFKREQIDFQGTGKQVVGPGSVHPNGEKYKVLDDSQIAYISRKDLEQIFGVVKEKRIAEKKPRDESRSAKEFREILKLLKREKTRTEIFTEMNAFAKWSSSPSAYKDYTYNKAYDWFLEREEKVKVRKQTYLKLTNYVENSFAFWERQPFFYDQRCIWWLWDCELFRWKIVDETDLLNAIDTELSLTGETITSRIKQDYLEAFRRVGRLKIPKEAPSRWIQFKDKAFSLRSGKVYDIKPNYFFTNPIPWEIGDTDETPVMDKLFEDWVGVEFVPTLYEILAYCCLTDMPIHLCFCLVGSGRNGKTIYQRLLNKFLGAHNCVSSELDLLADNRFETFKLYKKLACQLGETNWGVMKKTSLFKKLVGGDLIGFEKKNKDPFDDYNYAKIIINSNSLPTSDDTSEGFYRRWLILNFPNEFPEGKDILAAVPDSEYENLARKVIRLLPRLLERGSFLNQGTITERKERYIMASNPLSYFLKERCEKHEGFFVESTQLYQEYCKYLRGIKARVVKRKEFNVALNEEGFYAMNTRKTFPDPCSLDENDKIYKNGWWIDGIKLKE